MALRTSLVLSGDASGATSAVDALDNSMEQAAAEAAKMAAAYDKVDRSIAQLGRAQAAAALETAKIKAAFDNAEINLEQYNQRLLETNTALGLVKTQHSDAVKALKQTQDALGGSEVSAGQAASGYQNLGRQLQDVAVQLQGGANLGTIISQQGGQVADAVAQMGGRFAKVAEFLAGPFGAAIIVGVGVLVNLAESMWKAGDAADDQAKKADKAAQANETLADKLDATKHSFEEVIDATRAYNREQVRANQLTLEGAQAAAIQAAKNLDAAKAIRQKLAAEYDATLQNSGPGFSTGGRSANYGGNYADTYQQNAALEDVKQRIAENHKALVDLNQTAKSTVGSVAQEMAKLNTDPKYAIEQRFQRLRREAIAAGGDVNTVTQRLTALNRQEEAEAAAADKSAAAHGRNSDAKRAAAEAAREAERAAERHAKAEEQLAIAVERGTYAFDQRMRKLAEQTGSLAPGILGFEPPKKVTVADQIGGLARDAAASTAAQFDPNAGLKDLSDSIAAATAMASRSALGIPAETFFLNIAKSINGPLAEQLQSLLGPELFKKFGNVLGGAAMGEAVAGKVGAVLGGLKGLPGLPAGITEALGKGLKGAEVGTQISGLAKALGIKMSQTGAQIGGAIGSFIPIPGGQIIGSIAGGLIGNLFKKVQSGYAQVRDGAVTGTYGRTAGLQSEAANLANSMIDGFGTIADRLGATLGQFSFDIGKKDDKYGFTPGTGAGAGITQWYTDQKDALAAALSSLVSTGAFKGISSKVASALRSSNDIDKAVKEALSVKDLETALGGVSSAVEKEFRTFRSTAEERVRIARKYGFDLVAVDKLNADERLKLEQKLLDQQTGSLKKLIDDMTFGGQFEGSAVDKRQAILDQIGTAKAQTDQGVEGAADKLASLLADFNEVSKSAFGTTDAFAADRSAILDAARDSIAKANQRIADAKTAAQSDPALAETNAALDENNSQNAQMIALLQGIGINISGLGGGGVNDYAALARMAAV